MTLVPLRFEPLNERVLVSNEAGDFFLTDEAVLDRLVRNVPNAPEQAFLERRGFAFRQEGDFFYRSFVRRLGERKRIAPALGYLIVVPTLRCDLACSYCQVSRANADATGFDWTEEQLRRFFEFLDGLETDAIKIEFQGGEPTLRLDIVERIVEHAERRFAEASFVACTNLMRLPEPLLALLERPSVSLSTSIDGPPTQQTANRTGDAAATARFLENLSTVTSRFGRDKISALATIPRQAFEHITGIVDFYAGLGFATLFLRPVNYQGFARKRHATSRDDTLAWQAAYRRALEHIMERNRGEGPKLREYGLELALQRIFRRGSNGHVDLRSPNPAGRDYLVVDYDGRFYPSDEARMLARIGHADLSIGDLEHGVDQAAAARLSWHQMNELHEDCLHCAFQPYCGIDLVDDLSRYSRADLPKHETHFCRMNAFLFGLVFELLAGNDPDVLANLAGHLTGVFEPAPFFAPALLDS